MSAFGRKLIEIFWNDLLLVHSPIKWESKDEKTPLLWLFPFSRKKDGEWTGWERGKPQRCCSCYYRP
jgi:hypothetical protein